MNQYIFTTSRLDRNHGGLTSSMLKKVNILNEKMGIKPLVLTFHLDVKYESIVEEIKDRYNLKEKAIFLNINSYFKEKNVDEKLLKFEFNIDENLSKKLVDGKITEYYSQNNKVYETKYNNNQLSEIKKFSNDKITEKILLDKEGYIFTINHYKDGMMTQQDLYKRDQTIFESRFFEKVNNKEEINKIILYDKETIEFKSLEEFKHYFITLFIKKPLTYIVVENRNIDQIVLNINDDRVRKIFMTHSIHIRPKTDIIRKGNRPVLKNLNKIDALILLTEFQKKDIITRFGYRSNYYVIPHAIKTETKKFETEKNNVVIVSRLHEEKRLEQAIRAFKKVVEWSPDAVLNIYGEGKDRKHLEKLIDNLNLNQNVFLRGYTHNINQALQSAECTLLTSIYEGFALVVQESLANGTPVIAYDIKYGPSDMIEDGKNGYLIEDGNIDQLARKIYMYLFKNEDEKNKFIESAILKAQSYSYERFANNWNDLFNNLENKEESYKPSVKLTNIELKKTIYQISIRIKLNTKECRNPTFKFLFYKRSTLQNKETMEYIGQNVDVTKIEDDVFDIKGNFDPELCTFNDIYDLTLEIQDYTQHHFIRVGNNRNQIDLARLGYKNVRPYYTENHDNLSFDLRPSTNKYSKYKYLKNAKSKFKKLLSNKSRVELSIDKVKVASQVPQTIVKYLTNERTGNLVAEYQNLKNLHPILKKHQNYYYKLIEVSVKLKKWNEAHYYINKMLQVNEKDKFLYLKAILLRKCGKQKESINILKKLMFNKKYEKSACLEISRNYYDMKEMNKAINYLEKYLKLKPYDIDVLTQLINYLIKNNDKEKAIQYYNQLLNENKTNLKEDKLSSCYLEKGKLENELERFEDAKNSFIKVTQYTNDPSIKKWGIGHIFETVENYKQAIKMYEKRLEKDNSNAELYFKLATISKKVGKIEKAISYFENALALNKVRSPWYYQLALCYEELEEYERAIYAYKNAILRQQTHRPDNYRRLAYLLDKNNQSKAALEAYAEAELFRRPSYMSKALYNKYLSSIPVRYGQSYNYYEIDNQLIFYESMGGAGINGNPWAIFDYIYYQEEYSSFTHIWVINSFDNIPIYMRDKENILFVKKNSDAYLKYISKAKYLVCDSTFSDYVVRKPNQKYLQTTHGIFYKTVGRDSNGSQLGVAGSTRNLLQATHIIAPNQFMLDKQKSSYSIDGIHTGDLAKVGYPRIDITLNASEEQRNSMASRMNLEEGKGVVLYAPTWRGENKESNSFDIDKLIYDLNELSKIDANILFRGHSITKSLLKDVVFPKNVIIPPSDISTNHLMSIVDVLISDYSSVFFDFIPTERPIIHYIYDIEDYVSVRGLNIPTEDLPGYIAKNTEELVSSVKYSLENPKPSEKYLQSKNKFCPYDNGNSSETVAKWFLEGEVENLEIISPSKNQEKALFLIGTFSDSINATQLIQHIDSTNKSGIITSLSLKKSITNEKNKTSQIVSLGSDINLIPNAGPMVKTFEELVAIRDIEINRKIRNGKTQYLYDRAYSREKRRLFGDTYFHYVFNYEDNKAYWKGLYQIMKSEEVQ